MQSPTAAALLVQLHVGLEVAVNVLVANAGQVPLMNKPEFAAAVVTARVVTPALVRVSVPSVAKVKPEAWPPKVGVVVPAKEPTKSEVRPVHP